jgi:hypothetical protein
MGDRRGVYGVLVGKPERKRPLVRPRHRWKDNIKIDLQEVELVVVCQTTTNNAPAAFLQQ